MPKHLFCVKLHSKQLTRFSLYESSSSRKMNPAKRVHVRSFCFCLLVVFIFSLRLLSYRKTRATGLASNSASLRSRCLWCIVISLQMISVISNEACFGLLISVSVLSTLHAYVYAKSHLFSACDLSTILPSFPLHALCCLAAAEAPFMNTPEILKTCFQVPWQAGSG